MKRVEIELSLDESHDEELLRAKVAKKARVDPSTHFPLTVLKRSIDARRGRVRIKLLVELSERKQTELALPRPRETSTQGLPVVIVGDGPAGLFCAYELARQGIRSVVVDRGKPVQPRRRDLKGLNQHGRIDGDSNYCFGEGGAGTFSDGKLYTRSHKRGDVRDVIEILAHHGAPEQILSDARPHIGSNKLPVVIQSMRAILEECGIEFYFDSRIEALVTKGDTVVGARDHNGVEYMGSALVLATGHSARDIIDLLKAHAVTMEAKTFALGVRIEHPQPLINTIQYGASAGHPALPAASYRLAHHENDRGVYSFCMCPGGWIVPASTESGGLVVNGMSLSKRDSPFANSGMVVSVSPDDLHSLGYRGVDGGIALQREIETAAFTHGGGELKAPAIRVTDFLKGRESRDLPTTSYIPGITPGDMAEILKPCGDAYIQLMRAGLKRFGRSLAGYVTEEAVMVAAETRTSSPVRVVRDPLSLESTSHPSLYPCGEGAGYAGGIVSAALDGKRVARAIASRLAS